MLKSLFFGTTEIGDIAWIKVNTEEAAKEADFVHDLSSRRCAELDDRKWLWFVANHRKPDRDGATAFFLITVRALHPSGKGGFVFLYRNANWFDASTPNRALGAMNWPINLLVDPAGALKIFLDLHDDRTGHDVSEREKSVKATYPKWHASVLPAIASTWENRGLVVSHTYGGQGPFQSARIEDGLMVSHRFIRFTATVKRNSSSPVLFAIDRDKMPAGRYEIVVSAPDFEVFEKRTLVTVGTACPPQR